MDMSLVSSAMTAQSSSLQTNITMQLMTNNAAAEKQDMQILLGTQGGASSRLVLENLARGHLAGILRADAARGVYL